MRLENFTENEHYHLFGRGVNKENIFIDDEDKARFVFLITHFQSPAKIYNVGWYTRMFLKKKSFSTQKARVEEILKKRNIELVAFVIMPNRFHLLVKNLSEGILSVYMQRVLTAYSKYFNMKYGKQGHVFEGPYRALHIKNNAEVLNLSALIHKSPKEMNEWKDAFDRYPYSSYQDYIGINRWGEFLSPEAVLKQFKNQALYRNFVETKITKEAI